MEPEKFAKQYRKALKFSGESEVQPHSNYSNRGISPDLHSVLTHLASEDPDRFPTTTENAAVILGSGDTNLFPSLGQALAAEGHPWSKILNWKRIDRGLKLDRAMQDAYVTNSGSGLNARATQFGSLRPHQQLELLSGVDQFNGLSQHSEGALRSIRNHLQQKFPDATPKEIENSIQRQLSAIRVHRENQRRETLKGSYQEEIRRHLQRPDYYAHPGDYFWRNNGYEGEPGELKARPEELLTLKSTHPRKF